MKIYIKSDSHNGYLYIFKHGLGPGTIPKDVAIVKEKDLPNGYTAVWLDRFLRTTELKAYDIPSETEINRYLDRIGYCQKDGDVVPCDEVEASSYVKSAREPKWWGSNFSCKVIDAYNEGKLTYKNIEEWETKYNGGTKPSNMGTKAILDYYIKTGKDPRDDVEACGDITTSTKIHANSDCYLDTQTGDSYTYDDLKEYWYSFKDWDSSLADFTSFEDWFNTSIENGIFTPCDEVEACGDIKASSDTKYLATMVNCSKDELGDEFLVEGYYDNQYRGLAESAETSDVSALNELINDYANRGYFIRVHNLTDGVITEFSPDNWFDDLARDGGAALFMSW